ncbi:MAG TPA: serine/threonine-protein kinase, partial [Gemmatimonadaceae bacterium]|nr:serine/threonine-protein kinase [Gemmatimonadaceae bacterium]
MSDAHGDGTIPAPLRRLSGRYDLLTEIGRGGMSVVYRARERATGRDVAIKVVSHQHSQSAAALERFAREARTMATLRHPNIVETLAIEEVDGATLAIVSAFVPGETLRHALRMSGVFSYERAALVLRDVCAALMHAHQHRIMHRDVKPENILLEASSGRALLTDFGIARSLDADTALTTIGASVGTPTYMSPEQVDGHAVDERTDVYSLGLVGWEMLSGRRPWEGETLYAMLHKQQHEPLPSLTAFRPDIPPYLRAAIDGALAKDRSQRWQ